MLRRNFLIGSLVAGAFVLPTLAVAAGVVTGVCSNCHTMHASQNGGTSNANAQLLVGSGCAGCHADSGATNVFPTGLGTGLTGAPQVDEDAVDVYNAGGYFGATAANMHNPTDLGVANTNFSGTTFPGNDTIALTGNEVSCQGCHTSAGHHTSTGGYRMLGAGVSGTAASYAAGTTNAFPGDRSTITYDATNLNLVCNNCHGDFHGKTATEQGTASPWIRHPTDVSVGAATGPSVQAAITYTDAVVVGTSVAGTDTVMCLSCHVAHGGPNVDLLAFAYSGSGNYAGDGSRTGSGCEVCHSYTTTGM